MKVDYRNGKVYRIVCDELPGHEYIGSTACPRLSERIKQHRADLKNYLAGKQNKMSSYAIVQHASAKIILLEKFACASKDELRMREQHWMEQRQGTDGIVVVNQNRAYRKREINREYNREYMRKLRKTEEGREKSRQSVQKYQASDKFKAWRNAKHSCPCGGAFTTANRIVHHRTNKHRQWQERQAMQAEDKPAPIAVTPQPAVM